MWAPDYDNYCQQLQDIILAVGMVWVKFATLGARQWVFACDSDITQLHAVSAQSVIQSAVAVQPRSLI